MKTQREIDQVLVERFQAGEKMAFDFLAAKYQRRLLRAVSRMIRDRSEAEDVVQETLFLAFRALPGFRKEAAFYTWIFQIGINAAKNSIKRKALRADVWIQLNREHEAKPDYQDIVADDHSPLAILENKQTVRALQEALAELPAKMSEPLLLCDLEGMSYAQIAHLNGCPVGTVRSRIARARGRLALKIRPLLEPHSTQNVWPLR